LSATDAITVLVAQYQRQPGVSFEELRQWPAYTALIEELGSWGDITDQFGGMDSDYAERRPEWLRIATDAQRRRWLFTLGRAERWQDDYSVVLHALQGGQLAAVAGSGALAG